MRSKVLLANEPYHLWEILAKMGGGAQCDVEILFYIETSSTKVIDVSK